jgi:hypothetical protein
MNVIKESVEEYICVLKCPKCKIEIIVDKKEDLG